MRNFPHDGSIFMEEMDECAHRSHVFLGDAQENKDSASWGMRSLSQVFRAIDCAKALAAYDVERVDKAIPRA